MHPIPNYTLNQSSIATAGNNNNNISTASVYACVIALCTFQPVYVLGYAQFYSSTDAQCPPTTQLPTTPSDSAQKFNAAILAMNELIKQATASTAVTYVDVDAGFEGIGSATLHYIISSIVQ